MKYSLKTLLITITVVSVFIYIASACYSKYNDWHKKDDRYKKAGLVVIYDNYLRPDIVVALPDLFNDKVSSDEFPDTVNILDLSDCDIGNKDIAGIELIENLEVLSLNDTNISDSGFKFIAKCNNLIILHIENTAVSDRAISDIVSMKKLEELHVKGTHLTNDGIEIIRAQTKVFD